MKCQWLKKPGCDAEATMGLYTEKSEAEGVVFGFVCDKHGAEFRKVFPELLYKTVKEIVG